MDDAEGDEEVVVRVFPEEGEQTDMAESCRGHIQEFERRLVTAGGRDVHVTLGLILASKKHALSEGPGAPVPEATPRHVERVRDDILDHYIQFISGDSSVVLLDAITQRKTFVVRKATRAALYASYILSGRRKGFLDKDMVGRTFFYARWPKAIGDINLEAECICPPCFNFGFTSFRGLQKINDALRRQFSTDVPDLENIMKRMETSTSFIEGMLERDFHLHTALQSRVHTHCRFHALSAPHGQRLANACEAQAHVSIGGELPEDAPRFTPADPPAANNDIL